jgi:hypothetical protein
MRKLHYQEANRLLCRALIGTSTLDKARVTCKKCRKILETR